MLDVHEFNRIQDLDEVAGVWKSLLAQTSWPSFFRTLEWLKVYWKHYGETQKLRVLVVSEQGSPIGILPLVVRRERTKAGRLRFLTYPLDSWGSYYGPLGPRPRDTLCAGLAHVRRTKRDWDVLEPRWLTPDDAAQGLTAAALEASDLPAVAAVMDQSAVIRLDGDFETYFAARHSKWRNNYRRWERRLQERGTVRHVRYRPAGETAGDTDPRWDLYDACVEVASRSWQAVDNDTPGTTLCHESIDGFLRDVHVEAARCGALDMNLMYLNDSPLAFAYNYCHHDQLYALRIGYDGESGRNGVGNLLYINIIRDSFARGDHTYDLGPGSLSAKQYLLTSILDVVRYSHYPKGALRAQLVRLKRSLSKSE